MLAACAAFPQAPGKTVPLMPADEAAYKKALAIGEPGRQLAAILQFFTAYPNSRSVPMMIVRGYAIVGRMTSARALELAQDIAQRVAKASPMARSEAAKAIAVQLWTRNIAGEAEPYARAAVKELSEEDHVARERAWYQQKVDYFTARDPKYKAVPFYVEEAREKYRTVAAGTWSTLARVLMKQGRDADARQALGKSLAISRTADAASAYAELAAKEGDTHTVLDALGTAILTGKATKEMVERFDAAYRTANMRLDSEAWLDRRFRSESRNPLQPAPFRGPTTTPHRAVLLEMVTGAACEPCISVDLAVDAMLQRYSRQDLVILAHHMHAPSIDPLVSGAAEERVKFYGTRGAPTVYLDGEEIEPGEGTAAAAKPVFDELDAAVRKRLAAAAGATIDLKAQWSGTDLEVTAEAFGVEAARGLRLHLFLVEKEVSYSGENGFRLHPMVVRSAKDLEGLRGEWTTAVDQVSEELRKSMERYLEEMRARFPERTFALREERYRVDPRKLAVVAVLQDVETKKVLQAAYLDAGK
jgi:hypothetical protein